MTVLNTICWGSTIGLWLLVLPRMIRTERATRRPRPAPRRRNTGGRRRNHTNPKDHP